METNLVVDLKPNSLRQIAAQLFAWADKMDRGELRYEAGGLLVTEYPDFRISGEVTLRPTEQRDPVGHFFRVER